MYAISSEEHAHTTCHEYFNTKECYRCSICDFQHTGKEEVLEHIKTMHMVEKKGKKVTVLQGFVGNKENADEAYEKKFFVQPFNPIRKQTMDPETYLLLRNRTSIGIQCTIAGKDSTNSRQLIGGAGEGTSDMDRLPESPRERLVSSRSRLLKIRKGLRSKLTGCENTSNSCFMNSTIQALFNINTFKQKIYEYTGNTQNLIGTLRQIFRALETVQDIDDIEKWLDS